MPIGLPYNLSRRRTPEDLLFDAIEPRLQRTPGPRLRGRDLRSAAAYQGSPGRADQVSRADFDLPVIPNLAARRPMTLAEIGNANVVGRGRPTTRDRLSEAAAMVGRSRLFDPQSEDFLESFLGSALGTYGGIRGEREAREASEADLAAQIESEAMGARREARGDRLDELLTLAQLRNLEARTQKTVADIGDESPELDLELLIKRMEEAGNEDVADILRQAPGKFTTAFLQYRERPDEDEAEDELTFAEEQALERYQEANEFATREATRAVSAGTLLPSEVPAYVQQLRHEIDPRFSADSALASEIFGPEAADRTGASRPSSAPSRWIFPYEDEQGPSESIDETLFPPRDVEEPEQADSDAPRADETVGEWVRRMKDGGKTPDQIRRLATEHGLIEQR